MRVAAASARASPDRRRRPPNPRRPRSCPTGQTSVLGRSPYGTNAARPPRHPAGCGVLPLAWIITPVARLRPTPAPQSVAAIGFPRLNEDRAPTPRLSGTAVAPAIPIGMPLVERRVAVAPRRPDSQEMLCKFNSELAVSTAAHVAARSSVAAPLPNASAATGAVTIRRQAR
jgi:hypothetical protein